MNKKRLAIFFVDLYWFDSNVVLYKDFPSYGYYLSKYYDWETSLIYFADEPLHNKGYEEQCKLIYLGKPCCDDEMFAKIEKYIGEHSKDIDVAMVINYGHIPYRIANICKKYNKKIKIWSKLDMNCEGFSHFYDGTLLRALKSSVEIIKSRNIDLFTVECREYYDILKDNFIFKNRIIYLPNCVSMLDIDLEYIDQSVKKENIVLFVGRVGHPLKNNELLVNAVEKIGSDNLNGWKVKLIGPVTEDFYRFIENKFRSQPWLKNCILLEGSVTDRNKLYSMMAQAKIICLTSISESFGISVVEAGTFGCYPILTDFGLVTKDLTDNGRVGRVVKNNDVEILALTLLNVFKDEHLDELCNLTKIYMREKFSYKYWCGHIDEYLKSIL